MSENIARPTIGIRPSTNGHHAGLLQQQSPSRPANSFLNPLHPRLNPNRGDGSGEPQPQILQHTIATSNNNASATKNDNIFDSHRDTPGGMRVGRDFQAKIPQCVKIVPKERPDMDKALLVWSPNEKLTDEQVEDYLNIAKEKYSYAPEQALGLLFWHKHDVARATGDLGNFTPNPEDWTLEDKVLFEQAYQFHGKAFDRIRQMLPDKSMSSLIRYYYKWKKLKCRSSVMDRQVRKFNQEDGGDDQNAPPVVNGQMLPHGTYTNYLQPNHAALRQAAAAAAASDSDSDDIYNSSVTLGQACENCGIPGVKLNATTNKENLCNSCYLYWMKAGEMRPLAGSPRRGDKVIGGVGSVQQRYPPKGIYIDHDDLQMLASADPQEENVVVQALEQDIHKLKNGIQNRKQKLEKLDGLLLKDEIKSLLPDTSGLNNRINNRWTQEELLMAAQGVRRYGKDFKKISEVMGTKSEQHLKNFYANYRRRYDLDTLQQQHELEVGAEQLQQMMEDNNSNSDASSNIENHPVTRQSGRR